MAIHILYGSQTGQAQTISEQLQASLQLDFPTHPCTVQPLNDFKAEAVLNSNHSESVCIIVCSTTGDGDAPDNASKFVRQIRRRTLPGDTFSGLRYTVLGLGDTNYSNFCQCGKTVDRRLVQLGGQRFHESAWADDAVGLELTVEPWLEALPVSLCRVFHLVAPASLLHMDTVEALADDVQALTLNGGSTDALLGDDSLSKVAIQIPKWKPLELEVIFEKQKTTLERPESSLQMTFPSQASPVLKASLLSSEQVSADGAVKAIYYSKVQLPEDSNLSWHPGDSVGIFACNNLQEVEDIVNRLLDSSQSLNAHCRMGYRSTHWEELANLHEHLLAHKKEALLPSTAPEAPEDGQHRVLLNVSLTQLLLYCVDVRRPPSKVALRTWAEYCTDTREKRRMLELSSREGMKMYNTHIREAGLSVVDLLLWFPSCKPPVAHFLVHLPALLPRSYSMCDAPSLGGVQELTFVYSLVHIPASENRRHGARYGVCTRRLVDQRLQEEPQQEQQQLPTVFLYHRKNLNHFALPEDTSLPLVLVGAGTGVAPFIGFLQQRQRQYLNDTATRRQSIWLFYGCRHPQQDFIFEKELKSFCEAGVLSHLCVGFSRGMDGDVPWTSSTDSTAGSWHRPTSTARYVMECMDHHGQEVANMLLEEKGLLMVCGDARGLSKSVAECLHRILLTCGPRELVKTAADVATLVKEMRTQRRYIEDVWT